MHVAIIKSVSKYVFPLYYYEM